MKNGMLTMLYNHIKLAIEQRHPYDEKLVGLIAEMFLDFDKEVTVTSIHSFCYKGENVVFDYSSFLFGLIIGGILTGYYLIFREKRDYRSSNRTVREVSE